MSPDDVAGPEPASAAAAEPVRDQRLTADPPPAPSRLLYDARRGLLYAKPLWRGWSHLAWFEVSLVTGTLLVVAARGAAGTAAVAVYAASVSGMFGVSALYHRGNWGARASRLLQRLDHTMIFFLIAGTTTPALVLGTGGGFGLACLGAVWAAVVLATVLRLARMQAREEVVGAIFIGLGCVGALALPGVWIRAGAAAGILMVAGGVCYVAGAVLYHRRWPDPVPAVFGYHEVFHAWVCAAATCQFVAILLLVR